MPLSSPFSHRLQTNYVAHPDEEGAIRDVIQEHYAIASGLDRELRTVEGVSGQPKGGRKRARAKRREHLAFVNHHRLLLSSIFHLPEDILSVIFWYLTPDTEEWSIGQSSSPHPIIRVSHVCVRWRAATISNAILWATLSIAKLPRSQGWQGAGLEVFRGKMQLLTEMVSTFVSRSRTCPIVPRISATNGEHPIHTHTYAEIVQPLVDVLRQARWADIYVRLDVSQLASPFCQLLDVPAISRDSIQKARLSLSPDSLTVSSVVADSLNLLGSTQLTWLDMSIPGVLVPRAKVNWATLTQLKLSCGITITQVLAVLEMCNHLVRCTIELGTSPTDISSPVTSVSLRCLETLVLTGSQTTPRFLQALNLPSLYALTLLHTHGHSPNTRISDTAFLELVRVYSQLTHLTFSYGPLSLSNLLKCLEGLPNLISLDLRPPAAAGDSKMAHLHQSVLLAMTPSLTQPCLCPKLENVVIYKPDLNIEGHVWDAFNSLRRLYIDGRIAYLNTLEVWFQVDDSEISLEGAAAGTVMDMYLSLRKSNVPLDGIELHFPPARFL